ncbi:MAG: SDR family oxidoreductase [Planctomycetes bacterium]|nr:SDR family oxidoreductase [Planctomycetota bacterium]
MPVARAIFAAIQARHPTTFARVDPSIASPAVSVVAAEDLAALLEGRADLPPSLRIGDVVLRLAESAEALVGATSPPTRGSLSGQVAVISGAASGLGLGVARGLHAAGAAVACTDVDAAGLAGLAASFGDLARVSTHVVDVTREDSVIAGFDEVLARFGRVDCVACCAGIAPAFELADFPLERWRLSLDINLTGYFLYGREAARIMQAQGHGGTMVLLSSKSGLEPSKANTAYNATKAGEIHMARGWAAELGRHGIRVNCIAPGNVFQGSKIWNADYIAQVARKRGIAPDEVIPYYIGLTALNRDIKPEDIANAAVFLASDAARCITGQVLVVDSGQVWSR